MKRDTKQKSKTAQREQEKGTHLQHTVEKSSARVCV